MPTIGIRPGEHVIDDGTTDSAVLLAGYRGLDLEMRQGYGVSAYEGAAEYFPSSLIVPESDWQGIVQEKEQNKTRLSDLAVAAGLPCKDQQQTNYCWVNAATHVVEIVRMVQNQPMVLLSPASAGAQITRYRNRGGWGKEALDWISTHGLVPVDKWPANAIQQQYATTENIDLALRYRQSRWWVLDTTDMKQIISCLLRGYPVSVGYSWWRHQVTLYDAVWIDNAIGVRFRNSWGMGYGDKGFGVLQGRRMHPDDATVPAVALAA